MKIAIFGLGYVGSVTGACLAKFGHKVIGVDANEVKVAMINEARSPVIEPELKDLIAEVVGANRFQATSDWNAAIGKTDAALICVGTPSNSNGNIDLKYVLRLSEQIGRSLNKKTEYYSIGVRSTVLPGTVEGCVVPIIEKESSKKPGQGFGICMIPEFLREGSSVKDFYNPSRTVIGEYDVKSGDAFADLFGGIKAPLVRTKIKVAEMVKYADNSFHALKTAFGNEIGNICRELGIDSHKVMDIFCMDDKLNLSPYYLRPGFAFGGSCLPKDLRAINYKSKMLDVETPVLNSILESNRKQIFKIIKKLMEYKGRSLGFLGLSFKAGTDDLRESPHVELIETMLGKGFAVKIYDENVSLAKLIGANKEYIEREIPHISSLMCSSATELIRNSEVIIVGNSVEGLKEILSSELREGQVVVDLVRIVKGGETLRGKYYGICW